MGGQEIESGVWAAIKAGSCGPLCAQGKPFASSVPRALNIALDEALKYQAIGSALG